MDMQTWNMVPAVLLALAIGYALGRHRTAQTAALLEVESQRADRAAKYLDAAREVAKEAVEASDQHEAEAARLRETLARVTRERDSTQQLVGVMQAKLGRLEHARDEQQHEVDSLKASLAAATQAPAPKPERRRKAMAA